jgi:Transposase IS66 family
MNLDNILSTFPKEIRESTSMKGIVVLIQTFSIQEIGLVAKEITYKLEVWQSPNGEILRAQLPQEIQGSHFGPTLRAFITHLYAQGMTEPAIHEFLQGIGIDLSTGQVNHILLNEAESYSKISETILKTGLEEAPYIRVDDTGEKHQHKKSYCTHIGGQYFAYYTTSSILLSDRAGQFAVFDHAGCWVHMERPLRKIICTSSQAEEELKQVRKAIWDLYDKLKEVSLTQVGKEIVHQMYTDLIGIKTISPEINAVINNFSTYREEMLKALEHPGLPLHNNDSERDIRSVAKRRNLSGSTKSDLGRKFRDGLLTIKQTCFRLGYNFWDYLQCWFRSKAPDLTELIRTRYRKSSC